jgi:hypothetical protein
MMPDISKDKFLHAYGSLLVMSWGNPALKKKLKAEPAKVLKEFGLDPEGAQVVLEPPGAPGPQATPESAVRLWNDGKKAGQVRFIYPDEPPEDLKTAVLSDQDLEGIAGGTWYDLGSCCCCTPCCSC